MRNPRAKARSVIMTQPRGMPIDKHVKQYESKQKENELLKSERIAGSREARGQTVTAQVIEGLVRGMLVSGFDNPQPTPKFHQRLWEMLTTLKATHIAIAAPRGHAKSTAVTHSTTLAFLLFGARDFALLLSDTYEQACAFVGDIKFELETNEDIHAVFGTPVFIKDRLDDIIVNIGGLTFRVMARGSGQKVRGIKWRSKRPNLIVGDDLENDEIVLNADRREDFRKWLFDAVLFCGSDDALYIIVGTVLHYDSALERLLNDPAWITARFRAHRGFDDFTEILWPGKHTEQTLRKIRQRYLNQGNPEGYAQEMLNEPSVAQNAYFRAEDLLQMRSSDYNGDRVTYYSAIDLAIGLKRRNDYTVIMTGSLDADGTFCIVDVRRGRWDSFGIIAEMLSVQKRYEPDLFGIEKGQHIQMAIMPFLDAEMRRTSTYINKYDVPYAGDKPARAKAIQAMTRAGAVRFDKGASWWPGLENELSKFTEVGAKSGHDDQVDTLASLGIMVADAARPMTQGELDEEELDELERDYHRQGVSKVTGY